MRMQPEDAGCADRLRLIGAMDAIERVAAILVQIERARPSGLSMPPAMPPARGARCGQRRSMAGGGVQRGHSALWAMVAVPVQPKASAPVATP